MHVDNEKAGVAKRVHSHYERPVSEMVEIRLHGLLCESQMEDPEHGGEDLLW